MESDIVLAQDNVKYNCKLVLALEADSTIQGCMWFENASIEPKIIGRIVGGSWDTEDSLTFKIEFALTDNPHSSTISQRDQLASYRVTGSLISGDKERHPAFIAVAVKITSSSALPNNQSAYIPLDEHYRLEYSCVCEATNSWYHFVPGPRRMFQTSDDYELESGEYFIRADLDGDDGLMPYYLHVWLWYTDFVPPPCTHVSWATGHANDGFDPQLFADVWKVDRLNQCNKYKIFVRAAHRNSRNIKDHVGNSLTVWRSGNANKNHGDAYLCVKRTSRIEEQLVWSFKKRYGRLLLILEGANNSSIGGSAQYFVSKPV